LPSRGICPWNPRGFARVQPSSGSVHRPPELSGCFCSWFRA
jgi:hypothetical protein